MQSFTRDRRLRPFEWGVKLSSVLSLLYLLILLLAYYGYITIDPTKIAVLYPGFSTDPAGLAIGFLWIVLEAFAVGYIMGLLSLFWSKDELKPKAN